MLDAETQEVVAAELTECGIHNTATVSSMLDKSNRKVKKFYGDGSDDTWNNYTLLDNRNIKSIIPPQKNAKIKRHDNSKLPKLERDEAIRGIRKRGRAAWKRSAGYHKRSLAETAMYRMKQLFSGRLKNRHLRRQQTEIILRCNLLNQFTKLGLPIY
jgi:hypothetical protein